MECTKYIENSKLVSLTLKYGKQHWLCIYLLVASKKKNFNRKIQYGINKKSFMRTLQVLQQLLVQKRIIFHAENAGMQH